MLFIEALCLSAMLYLMGWFVQLGLDVSMCMLITALIKAILGLAVVKVLDTFCGIGLSPVSWFLVAAPFVITSLATAISMGTNFDENVFVFIGQPGGEDTKETFTVGSSGIRQPNPPGAGEPPEPGITPATQSWTEAAMGNQWGTNYDPKWSRSASNPNGEALQTKPGIIGIQLGYNNTL
jgi:hypothetical protein